MHCVKGLLDIDEGAAEPRKRRLKAQWFYMSKIIYLFIYLRQRHSLQARSHVRPLTRGLGQGQAGEEAS